MVKVVVNNLICSLYVSSVSTESPSKSKKKTSATWDEILHTLSQDAFEGPSLDAGCGRGLVLIKTAQMKERRQIARPAVELTPVEYHGGSSSCSYSFGVDVFPSSDREGDHAYATCRNIYAENLSSAVVINTATMLNLPFEDERFSLVTCNMACE